MAFLSCSMQTAEQCLDYVRAVSLHILSPSSTKHPAIDSVGSEITSLNNHKYTDTCTVTPRYTINQLTSFPLYDIHKLMSGFQLTSQFIVIRAPSSNKPIFVAGASTRL
jgi:hypothetical protein